MTCAEDAMGFCVDKLCGDKLCATFDGDKFDDMFDTYDAIGIAALCIRFGCTLDIRFDCTFGIRFDCTFGIRFDDTFDNAFAIMFDDAFVCTFGIRFGIRFDDTFDDAFVCTLGIRFDDTFDLTVWLCFGTSFSRLCLSTNLFIKSIVSLNSVSNFLTGDTIIGPSRLSELNILSYCSA